MITLTKKVQDLSQKVKAVHTLGPAGTNCEKAGLLWLDKQKIKGEVVLHNTLEEAIPFVENKNSILLGCAVYPKLHCHHRC
ncbi:hypothetical protein ABEW06_23125, partial [Peribacillus simplex]